MTLAPFYSEHAIHRFLQNADTIYQTKPNQTKPNQTNQTIQSHRITYQKVSQSCYGPEVPTRGFQEVKVPRLCDNGTGWW